MDDKKDREMLRDCLQRIVDEEFQNGSRITRVQPRLSNYSSSFASYIVSVQADHDLQHTIFLKDFSIASRPVQQLEDRRKREFHVYREVLGDAGLGTPRYYGSLWDESQDRFWLFLEFVDGKPLKETGFEQWMPAVRWLGRLHAYSIRNAQLLEASTFLERHDHRFFLRIAEAAPIAVSKFSAALADRVASVVSGYVPLVEAMATQPPVLVHGSYRAGHVLLDRRTHPPRVCPVDWESAALGSGLFDLAYLSDGFEPPQLDEIIDAYRDEVGKCGASIPGTDKVVKLMDCYRLHRNLKWLGWAWNEKFSPDSVVKLVARAERLAGLVS